MNESCWSGSGGGISAYELWESPSDIANGMGPWTPFQYGFTGQGKGTPRQTPDISFNADPASGVYMYDTYGYGGWLTVGGTSVSSPALAGIINSAGNKLGQGVQSGYLQSQQNNLISAQLYTKAAYKPQSYDLHTGSH